MSDLLDLLLFGPWVPSRTLAGSRKESKGIGAVDQRAGRPIVGSAYRMEKMKDWRCLLR